MPALSRLLCDALGPYARAKSDAANLRSFFRLCLCLGRRPARAQYSSCRSRRPRPGRNLPPQPVQPQALPPVQPQASASGAAAAGPAPYDHDLQRLAEILGALHFLRGICGSNEGQKWRNEAQALIDAEAPAGERHDQMVASFNRGYRAFQQSYRTCTPAADFAVRRYLDEGARIAREITARYAN